MPMVLSDLAGRIERIIGHNYYNDQGAPLYVFSAQQTSFANAGNAWADALVAYSLTATAAGSPAVPTDLTTKQPVMASNLATQFSTNNDPASASTALINEIGNLWFVPPVTFPNGFVTAQVEVGKPAAISSLTTLGSTPSPVSLHNEMATIIDTYLRSIIAIFPGPPLIPVNLQ